MTEEEWLNTVKNNSLLKLREGLGERRRRTPAEDGKNEWEIDRTYICSYEQNGEISRKKIPFMKYYPKRNKHQEEVPSITYK